MSDNPPAFPLKGFSVNSDQPGMSLRDWFAGQALVAAWGARDKDYFEVDDIDIARCAYQLADAMLAARKEAPHA